MKKIKIFSILLFFLSLFLFNFKLININKTINFSYAQTNEHTVTIKIKRFSNTYKLALNKNSKILNQELAKNKNIKKLIHKLKTLNFSNEEIAYYLYPQIKNIYEDISSKFYKNEISDEIFVSKNQCKINIKSGEPGYCINKEKFFDDFIFNIENNLDVNNYVLLAELLTFKNENVNKNKFKKRAEYKTYFGSSSLQRKHNIKVASECFDGIILNEGEKLSFNMTTGVRTKEKGYAQAKIIQNGTFQSGYGGGVCQVSTTLYNACLLAGLEIIEVHSHSLPVSYVEPSFDAMVNMGSSDLVVRNNTNSKLIITTSTQEDFCKVVIFGKENPLKIEKLSKKIESLPASNEQIIETDYKKYGYEQINSDEEIIISRAKDGLKSQGFLNYYDKNGNLIKTQKVRENTYYPTKAVVLKKENKKNK